MRGAYSEIYLDDAMRNMGEMVEYGEEACGSVPGRSSLVQSVRPDQLIGTKKLK